MVSAGVELVEVSDGVFARLHEGLTNAGIIVGDEGVMIIDSLRVPSFARALIEDVRKNLNGIQILAIKNWKKIDLIKDLKEG